MDELRILRVFLDIARLAVAEAAADGHDKICGGDRMIGSLLAMHPGKAQGLGMRARDCAQSHQRMRHRQMVLLHKRHHFGRGSG